MGRKKKKFKPIIFCFYCDRTFENEKVLIQHQRAKHFKCIVCHKRLGSAHGMMVHVFQVHKKQIDKVPHAKEGRDSFNIDIFGMSNIPQEIIDEKHAERGEPPLKRQKVENQQNPLIVNNVAVETKRAAPSTPMLPNPMMMNPMMNPMMMNPMMNPLMMMKPNMMAPHPPGAANMRLPNMPHPPAMGFHPYLPQQGMVMPPPPPHMMPPNMPLHPNANMHPGAMPGMYPPNPLAAQAANMQIASQATNNNMNMNSNNDKSNGQDAGTTNNAAESAATNGEMQPEAQNSKETEGKEAGNAEGNKEKKGNKKNHLVYSEQMVSMEEQRFRNAKYFWTANATKHENENENENQNGNLEQKEEATVTENGNAKSEDHDEDIDLNSNQNDSQNVDVAT